MISSGNMDTMTSRLNSFYLSCLTVLPKVLSTILSRGGEVGIFVLFLISEKILSAFLCSVCWLWACHMTFKISLYLVQSGILSQRCWILLEAFSASEKWDDYVVFILSSIYVMYYIIDLCMFICTGIPGMKSAWLWGVIFSTTEVSFEGSYWTFLHLCSWGVLECSLLSCFLLSSYCY